MAQHDFNIANQLMPPARADINAALLALASNSAGATAPAAPQQWQFWLDVSGGALRPLKIWDGTDWITVLNIDPTANLAGPANLALHDGGTTTGTGTAQVAALKPPIAAYAAGYLFVVKAGITNTGPLTLTFGPGALAVKDRGGAALAAGQWLIGRTYVLRHDGADLIVLNDLPLAPKNGQTSRVLTLADGTQAVVGVGFRPRYVQFWAAIQAAATASMGSDDATMGMCIFNNHNNAANTWGRNAGQSILLVTGSGVQNGAHIQSMDADGFTLVWTKAGAPAGTADIYYTAHP